MKALTLAAILLCSCVTVRPAPRVTWEAVSLGIPGAVWMATVDQHQYLVIARGNRSGVVHSEGCPHESHK